MKLTKQALKQIIKEELTAVLNEEELDEGMSDWLLGGALALGGIAGANKAYDTFNPNQETTHQVDDFQGPKDTRTDIQKSKAKLQHHKDAAESAAKQGDFDSAERHLRSYHSEMTRIEGAAKFMTGKDTSNIGADHGPSAVAKDLQQLKSIYGR